MDPYTGLKFDGHTSHEVMSNKFAKLCRLHRFRKTEISTNEQGYIWKCKRCTGVVFMFTGTYPESDAHVYLEAMKKWIKDCDEALFHLVAES